MQNISHIADRCRPMYSYVAVRTQVAWANMKLALFLLELGSRQNMTGRETKRAIGKCGAKLTRWFVSFAELPCLS